MEYALNNFVVPAYRTFNDIAIPVGILQSNISGLEKWLSTKFIGMHFRWYWDQIVFNNKPFYKWDCFYSKLIKLNTSTNYQFINSIREYILNGYYLYLFVNEMFIPHRNSYQKRNFIHDLCVYGFSDERHSFFISAYNDKEKYVCEEISYYDFYFAIKKLHFPFRQLDKIKWKNRAMLFKINDNFDFKKNEFDRTNKEIYKYCISYRYGSGINIYDYILKKLKKVQNHSINIDMHYFRILKEHINAVCSLHCKDINYYNNVLMADNLLLKALKYKLKRNDALLIIIKKDLLKLRQNEITALNKYARKNFNGFQYKRFLRVYKKVQLENVGE